MGKQITKTVTWVGKIDWELKTFHGEELSTHKGSSYNAYLIRDEKNVLIDTVWGPYDREFVSGLEKEIDLNKIDYVIVNHTEPDHSGALLELLQKIPNVPIYCTANAAKFLKAQYHKEWNCHIVKTGDTLPIGKNTLHFIEAPMLHWPDTMFTYMEGENILFSNDGFGQHYATEMLFNDEVDEEEMLKEALKYYANILAPFNKMVNAKVKQVLAMNLKIDMIAPSHGVIWRKNPEKIVEKYLEWSDNFKKNQITILYDTMWQSTRKMAQLIAKGIQNKDKEVTVKLYNMSKEDKNDILTEAFASKMIIVGSPTINNGYSYATAGILEMIKGMKLSGKKVASFGSYGWSGEACAKIEKELKDAGLEIIKPGLKQTWNPDEEQAKEAIAWGESLV